MRPLQNLDMMSCSIKLFLTNSKSTLALTVKLIWSCVLSLSLKTYCHPDRKSFISQHYKLQSAASTAWLGYLQLRINMENASGPAKSAHREEALKISRNISDSAQHHSAFKCQELAFFILLFGAWDRRRGFGRRGRSRACSSVVTGSRNAAIHLHKMVAWACSCWDTQLLQRALVGTVS